MSSVYWVELLGVMFSGRGEEGIGFRSLIDWYGVPEARGDLDPFAGSHGSYGRTEVLRESRVITLEGAIHAASRAELDELRMDVSSRLAGAGLMRVSDETGVWQRWVEVQYATIPDPGSGVTVLPVTVDVIAPDPVRYSEPLASGPAGLPTREGGLRLPARFPWNFGTTVRPVAVVENFGAVSVLPRLTVTGSGASVTVHGGGHRLIFGEWAGELVFDCADRSVHMNGREVTASLLRRDWPFVRPGEAAEFFLGEAGVAPESELFVEYQIGVW